MAGLKDLLGSVIKTNLNQGQATITGDLRRTTMNVLGQGTGGLIGTPQRIPEGNGDGVQARPASPATSGLSPQTQQLLNRNGLGQQQPTSVGGAVGGFVDRSVGTAERLIMPSDAAKRRVEYGIATTGATLNGAATAVREAVSGTPSQGLSENSPPQPAQPEQRSWWQRNVTDRFSTPTAAAAIAVAVSATPAAAIPEPLAPEPVQTFAVPAPEPPQPISRVNISTPAVSAAELQAISANVPTAPIAPPPASTVDAAPAVTTSVTPKEDFAAVAPAIPAVAAAPAAPATTISGSRFDAATYARAQEFLNNPKPSGMG